MEARAPREIGAADAVESWGMGAADAVESWGMGAASGGARALIIWINLLQWTSSSEDVHTA